MVGLRRTEYVPERPIVVYVASTRIFGGVDQIQVAHQFGDGSNDLTRDAPRGAADHTPSFDISSHSRNSPTVMPLNSL